MTFIKIDTVVYIDKDKGYIPCGPAIIHTEKIFDITPNQDETAWFIEMGDERHRHIVTAAEWARIAPLLMPVPAEPVAPKWYEIQTEDEKATAYARGFDDGPMHADSMEDTPRFTVMLVSAYREFQRMLSLTGITEAQLDSQRRHILALLDDALPLEETDNE